MGEYQGRFVIAPNACAINGFLESIVPPGFKSENWRLVEGFSYTPTIDCVPSDPIEVPAGMVFDGASVPMLLPIPFIPRIIFPRSHSNYMQAAALHDFLYSDISSGLSRKQTDLVFKEALEDCCMPSAYSWIMYIAVRMGGWWYWEQVRPGIKGDVVRDIGGEPNGWTWRDLLLFRRRKAHHHAQEETKE